MNSKEVKMVKISNVEAIKFLSPILVFIFISILLMVFLDYFVIELIK